MTSSNRNIFHVTGPLCVDFTGDRRIPRAKASEAELWCFLWSAPNKRLSKQSCGWWFETPSPYYHHQIGSMNYYPLFRVRSWNNGVRCMSFYILSHILYILNHWLHMEINVPAYSQLFMIVRYFYPWVLYFKSMAEWYTLCIFLCYYDRNYVSRYWVDCIFWVIW